MLSGSGDRCDSYTSSQTPFCSEGLGDLAANTAIPNLDQLARQKKTENGLLPLASYFLLTSPMSGVV